MNKKFFAGILASMIFTAAGAASVSAMPSDIREAVTQPGYNVYDHVNSYTYYDDSELISIGENYVAIANAMIRQSPFGTIYGSVTPGQTYYVVGECPDCMWYKISGDIEGYVYASYLVPKSQYSTGSEETGAQQAVRSLDMMMTVEGASQVNVRTAPSTNGAVVAVVNEGTEIHVTGNVLNTEWYECEYKNEVVYICDDYLTPEFPQTMACTAAELNVRVSADSNSQIIAVLKHGDKVKVSADENDWLRFSLPDGRIGYVFDEYMAAVN